MSTWIEEETLRLLRDVVQTYTFEKPPRPLAGHREAVWRAHLFLERMRQVQPDAPAIERTPLLAEVGDARHSD